MLPLSLLRRDRNLRMTTARAMIPMIARTVMITVGTTIGIISGCRAGGSDDGNGVLKGVDSLIKEINSSCNK